MCQQVDISPTSRPGLARRNTVRTVTQACRFTRFPNTKQYFPDLQKADRRYGSRRTAAWADWPIIKSRSCDIWKSAPRAQTDLPAQHAVSKPTSISVEFGHR